eukprot:CAMPEP_0114543056 /NCGR_PEP_ID=MMETSP0114-20121206/2155_2 /TAXON_ID=31324 /ORGANISM="Goniomonas sp, Strain m" /LENGTH=42 /DNA_ID= /DNA_START= /DNA_END= /DNA_ORIENTATION=
MTLRMCNEWTRGAWGSGHTCHSPHLGIRGWTLLQSCNSPVQL